MLAGRILTILLLFGRLLSLRAQEKTPVDTSGIAAFSIRYPYSAKVVKTQVSLGVSMVRPPRDILETDVQVPLLNFHVRYQLPSNLSLEGDFTTIIVSNQLSLGPGISFSRGSFAYKFGFDVAYAAGFIKQLGFNNRTRAWLYYPNVSLGYKMKQITFTVEAEAVVIGSITTESGKNELTHSRNLFNGFTGALYIEQRLHRNRIFVIGIKDSHVKYYWPAWMTFAPLKRYYDIPELYFSWII